MKLITSLFVLSFSLSSLAESSLKYISHFAVYTEKNIRVKCSDFLGLVAAGNDASLEHFLVNHEDEKVDFCPLNAKNRVIFIDGAVSKGQVITSGNAPVKKGPKAACIESDSLYTERVSYFNPFGRKEVDFIQLSEGVSKLESNLLKEITQNKFKVIELTKDLFKLRSSGHKELHLDNDGRPLLIFSNEEEINFSYLGLFFKNEHNLNPSQIFWYFPNAKRVNLFMSGISSKGVAKTLGIPGIILAPGANVNFNEVLISGAIYAQSLTGGSLSRFDYKSCDLSAGQINFHQFDTNLFPEEIPVPAPEEQDQNRSPRCRGKGCRKH